jgi:hypothetical protein
MALCFTWRTKKRQKQKGQAIKQIVLLSSATSLWKRIRSITTFDGDCSLNYMPLIFFTNCLTTDSSFIHMCCRIHVGRISNVTAPLAVSVSVATRWWRSLWGNFSTTNNLAGEIIGGYVKASCLHTTESQFSHSWYDVNLLFWHFRNSPPKQDGA